MFEHPPLWRLGALALIVPVTACSPDSVTEPDVTGPQLAVASELAAEISQHMDDVNAALAAGGDEYRVAMAEYVTRAEPGAEMGNTVIARDLGNKRLSTQFVEGDPRRAWSGPGANAVTYAVDRTGDAVPLFGGLGGAATDGAIARAMNSWNGLRCSELNMSRNPDFGLDIGVIAFLNGLGGSPFVFADVQHAGWRDINFPGGILGVAFTFVWVDLNGPTDIDADGYADTAFREIYYDPSWAWGTDGSPGSIDVETVALHEAGHGLSQAHFGTVRIKNDGSVKASPRAVMNALYSGPLRDLQGTDVGGHCASWGNWNGDPGAN